MDQPPLTLGGKPRSVDRRVPASAFPIAAASIPALRPSLQPQFVPGTVTIPQGPWSSSWCLCLCGVVVHGLREEPCHPHYGGTVKMHTKRRTRRVSSAPKRTWRHLNVCQFESEIVCALPRGRMSGMLAGVHRHSAVGRAESRTDPVF